jgi:hypothetical protein
MSCGCDNSGETYNSLCNADTPYPIVSPESVPSLIGNLVKSLYGTIQKDVSNGSVQWVIPCDPNSAFSVPGFPRNQAGLLCYLLQVAAGIVPETTLGTAIAPKTFTESDMGGTWLISGLSTPSITLPTLVLGSDYARRKSITFYNATAFNLTIQAPITNTVSTAWNLASQSTFVLQSNDTVTFTAQDDTSSLTWFATGNATLDTTSQFAGVPSVGGSTAGFQFLPGGLVLNWGVASFTPAGAPSVWPVAFPNMLLGSVCMGQISNARALPFAGLEKSAFVGFANSSVTAFILAIGY